jgi:serine/threonine protein kinase
MRFQCPFCRGIVAVENSQMGEEVQCGHCDEIVTVPRSRFATGSVIGDFIILEELGRGGMGVVYLAHQISLDRPAALKILQENYANNAEFVVNFIKEARSAAKLNHPHIVQAYAVGEDEGIFYFAMEYIDGETMKSVLKRDNVIAVDKAVTIIQQIAEALDCAWKEQKLIHRDIKPDNIMLTKNGRAKLADLGLSRVAGDIEDEDEDEIMGTPQYISPEHLTGAPMDVRSDLYSLGATFYQFVTGKFPYEGRTANEIARKHIEGTLVPPQMVNPKVPEALSQIVVKMMKKNVNERYQDAEELVDDLRMFRRGKLPSGLSVPKVFTTRTRSVSRSAILSGDLETNDESRPFQLELPTTTTGSLKPLYTSTTTTSSGLLFAGNLDDELQKPKRKLIVWTVLMISVIVIAGAALIWFYVIPLMEVPDAESINSPVAGGDSKPTVPVKREYIKAIDEMLLAFSEKPDEQEFLKKADRFFTRYPEPSGNAEEKKLKDFLRVYVNIDEKNRVEAAREKLHKEHLALIKEREEAEKRAVAEKRRQEEIRRKILAEEREIARKEQERKRKITQRAAKYKRDLNTRKNQLIFNFIEYAQTGKIKEANEMFSNAAGELDNLGTVTYDERRSARLYAAYADTLKQAFDKGYKINRLLTDSGTELKGIQVEITRGKLGRIASVEDGRINIKMPFSNRILPIRLEDLKGFYLRKFFQRVEKHTKLKDTYFYYMLFNGHFERDLDNYAPDSFWKKELPNFEYLYFKQKLEKASSSEKKLLNLKYGGLDSFKKAVKAAG